MEKEIACFAHEWLSLVTVWFLSLGTMGFKIGFGFISGTSFRLRVEGMDLGKKV